MRQLHHKEFLEHQEKYKFLRKENRLMFEQKPSTVNWEVDIVTDFVILNQ